MKNPAKRWKIVLGITLVAGYSAVLFRNLNESERRSLEVKEVPLVGDHIRISLRAIAVNPRASDVTVRMSFRFAGKIASDPITPAVNLKLSLNDIRGPQEIVWPRGSRVNPVEMFFALNGNENRYPIDSYSIPIRIMVTKPGAAVQLQLPAATSGAEPNQVGESDSGFMVSAAEEDERIPITWSVIASIPGLKFERKNVERSKQGLAGFDLIVRRADNVIVVSVLIMVLMLSLAISVLMMGLQSVSGTQTELLPLSLSVSLLFGLPALRNAQPGVPALGAFGDYLSFLWAEQLVAVSAVLLIWTWLTRQRRSRGEVTKNREKR